MGKIVLFAESRFGNEVTKLYETGLQQYDEVERKRIKNIIINRVILSVKKKLKEQHISVNFDELKNSVDFYDLLFDEMSKHLIIFSLFTKPISDEMKLEIMEYLRQRRDDDKNRILYDEDTVDEKPAISDYEFEIPRMLDDIKLFIERKIEDQSNGLKR